MAEGFNYCSGGHPGNSWEEDGHRYCGRCGEELDFSPCGCGAPGHEVLATSVCSNIRSGRMKSWVLEQPTDDEEPTQSAPSSHTCGVMDSLTPVATLLAIPVNLATSTFTRLWP